MLTANARLVEFVDRVAKPPYDDIIILADREATAAERHCCKQRNAAAAAKANDIMEAYALLLKDFLVFMRHGVATHALRSLGCRTLEQLPRS